MTRLAGFRIVLAVLLAATTTAVAQPTFDYTQTHAIRAASRPDQNTRAFLLDGDIAYVAQAYGEGILSISDCSTPGDMIEIGRLEVGEGLDTIRLDGTRLYAYTTAGVAIIDVADPTDPKKLGLHACSDLRGFTPKDDFLYVGNGWHSFQVVDVTDPTEPVLLSDFEVTSYAGDVAAFDQVAAVSIHGHGFQIIDVADPEHLFTRGLFDEHLSVWSLGTLGDRLVVNTRYNGIRIYDLNYGFHPQLVASYVPEAGYSSFSTTDDRIYACLTDIGLDVIDISNLPQIDLVARHTHLPQILQAEPHRDLVMTDLYSRGFVWIDPEFVPTDPEPLLTRYDPSVRWRLWAADGRLYSTINMSAYEGDLQIFDFAPENPGELLGEIHLDSSPQELELRRGLAYIAGQHPGSLSVVDVQDPTQPSLVCQFEVPGADYCVDVSLLGNRAYMGIWIHPGTGAVASVDISDPTAPVHLGSLPLPDRINAVTAWNGHVAAVTENIELYVLATGTAQHPGDLEIVGYLDLRLVGGGCRDLMVEDGIAWILANDGLLVVDISQPEQPTLMAVWHALGGSVDYFRQFAFVDDQVHIAATDSGVVILDVHDPTDPQLIGFTPANRHTVAVAVDDNAIYESTYNGELYSWPRHLADVVSIGDQSEPDRAAVRRPTIDAYPTPANPRTTIRFEIDRAQHVVVAVYDLRGARIAILEDGWRIAGRHSLTWDGRDDGGKAVPSGTYLTQMRYDRGSVSRKLTLVR